MAGKLLTNEFLNNLLLELGAMEEEEAIELAGRILWQNGYVEKEYIDGMKRREKEHSTYIGYGIAIPHGTDDSLSYVKKSGISVLQFKEGINYKDQTVYMIIGIACKEEDVIQELMQITDILAKEDLREKLLHVDSGEEFIEIINQNYEIEGEI